MSQAKKVQGAGRSDFEAFCAAADNLPPTLFGAYRGLFWWFNRHILRAFAGSQGINVRVVLERHHPEQKVLTNDTYVDGGGIVCELPRLLAEADDRNLLKVWICEREVCLCAVR